MAPRQLLIRCVTWCCFLVLMTSMSEAYRSGAPGDSNGSVCSTLTPGHVGTATQTTPAPYGIVISPNTYTPGGNPITVRLEKRCDFPLQGFLLTTRFADASRDGSQRPGSFDTPPESRRTCSASAVGPYLNQAVTHTSSAEKDNLTFTWTPPPSGAGGHIVFRATFLQTKPIYWVDVHSELLVDSTLGRPSDTSGFVRPISTTVAPGCRAPFETVSVTQADTQGSITQGGSSGSTKHGGTSGGTTQGGVTGGTVGGTVESTSQVSGGETHIHIYLNNSTPQVVSDGAPIHTHVHGSTSQVQVGTSAQGTAQGECRCTCRYLEATNGAETVWEHGGAGWRLTLLRFAVCLLTITARLW